MFNTRRLALLAISCFVLPAFAINASTIETVNQSSLEKTFQTSIDTDWQKLPSLKSKLKTVSDQDKQVIAELQMQLERIEFPGKIDILHRLAESVQANPLSEKEIQQSKFNFLDLQLQDSAAMLAGTIKAAKNTLNILQKMNVIAVDAASGVHSKADLENLNFNYQLYKITMNFTQTIYLYHGVKKLSSGDINLWFGSNNSLNNTLKIKVSAFDIAGLDLKDTSLTTISNASAAIVGLNNAINQVTNNLNAITLSLDDALGMLAVIPDTLSQDLVLFNTIHELTLQSINGTTSQEDRIHLDAAFNHVKAAITKTNSYVSLDGVKNLGGGDLHITIGYADKYNSLDVTVPPVDVQVLGLDKLNIATQESARQTLNAILSIKRNFVYLGK